MKIAVVDDEQETRDQLIRMCGAVLAESGTEAAFFPFGSGETFLSAIPENLDLLLLDIQMDGPDGLETAGKLRAMGSKVAIVFVTSMAQYAVQGYRVEAMDYLVKPVTQNDLSQCLHRICARIEARKENRIILHTDEGTCRLAAEDIRWIEAVNHRSVIYTADAVYHCGSTLSSLEQTLCSRGFFRCHSAFLVNLRQVERISATDAYIGDKAIPVSRHRKQEFQQRLAAYWGEQL